MTLLMTVETKSYRFDSCQEPSDSEDMVVTNVALIHASRNHCIYSGDLSLLRRCPPNLSRVVVKCAKIKSAAELLQKEYELYNGTLSSYQGVWLPRCYGMYHREKNKDLTHALFSNIAANLLSQTDISICSKI
ncbi:hypothetical protein OF83DRAFT_361515 [Amylostereum chailletii]|nr:hypothetical protein OF83DRAFT_361515 [Amylostereum chailletii]